MPVFAFVRRFERPVLLLLCAVFAIVCLSKARVIGDGLEYLAMTQGFAAHDQVVLHQGLQGATKLMRYWSNALDSGGLCAPGGWLAAGDVVTLASGWRYYNAPLRCDTGPAPGLRFGFAPGQQAPTLVAGWSGVEGCSVWTDAPRPTLRLALPPGRRVARIAIEGRYYEGVKSTQMAVNGAALGEVKPGPGPIAMPSALGTVPVLEIVLEHRVSTPHPGAREQRLLGFFLQGVYVEFAAQED